MLCCVDHCTGATVLAGALKGTLQLYRYLSSTGMLLRNDRSTRRVAAVFNPTEGASGGYDSSTCGSLGRTLLSLWGTPATRRPYL